MKNFLFDMDGTLTEPRKIGKINIIEKLIKLSKYGNIGVLTGSHLEYVMEQLSILIDNVNNFENKLYILPCNGTQFYTVSKTKELNCKYTEDMIQEIGEREYIHLIHSICDIQSEFFEKYTENTSGQFIQYRGSLLNWCPIGRDSNQKFRSNFIEKDKQHLIRKHLIKKLTNKLCKNNMQDALGLALGGSTSIDIYPLGWGKEYSLRSFPAGSVYFWGDKCFGDGNDATIYSKLHPLGRAFSVESPEDTARSIDNLMEKIKAGF